MSFIRRSMVQRATLKPSRRDCFVRPSSSVAKKIEASFKISLARRRSRLSRSSALFDGHPHGSFTQLG